MNSTLDRDLVILNSIFNPLLPIGESFDGDLTGELVDNEVVTPVVEEAKRIELEAVKAAEFGELGKAEQLFTRALAVAPRAAGYNNRAQLHRLKGNVDEAMVDLDKAIEISGGHGKAGCQAHCQRGLLHRLNGQEAEAKKDFELAASLGSIFAKQRLVEMNPYAAMCNQMLNEMMMKLNQTGCMPTTN